MFLPRALPWAGMRRPFRAEEIPPFLECARLRIGEISKISLDDIFFKEQEIKGILHFPVNTSGINLVLENFLSSMIIRFKPDKAC